jgi:hypothetical protein
MNISAERKYIFLRTQRQTVFREAKAKLGSLK